MNLYGLIGYPLEHSFSATYFNTKFSAEGLVDCKYELFPIQDLTLFPKLVAENPGLKGLNVTIPHKITILKYLDSLDPLAEKIGAVNCIHINESSHSFEGFNTDAYGFSESLKPLLRPWHQQALVLGTGGASKAVIFALEQLGIKYQAVSRTPLADNQISYKDINEDLVGDYTIIINTTPLGTYPDINDSPDLPYYMLGAKHLLYDLVYNPAESLFLEKGKWQGATTKNGREMLELQAEKSWEIWNR